MSALTRREVLAGLPTALVLPSLLRPADRPERSLRVAFATDMHVQPERSGGEGWAACLKHMHAQKDRPDLILTGGDLIMDSFGADPDRTKVQWDLFTKTTRENATIPVRHALGNHDIFGWANPDKYASDPRYGMKWACDALGIERSFYSFDQAGWHFIILDSTHPKGRGYTAKLTDEQFEWLQSDLAATPKETPVLIVSHIPILMVCAIFDGENEKTGDWVIPGSYMHIDARRITDLFLKHPNVKLCLSGHEHQIDQIEYQGVHYRCGGAVSAGWWGGDYFRCTFGYNLVDLFEDGSFEAEYVPYNWTVKPLTRGPGAS